MTEKGLITIFLFLQKGIRRVVPEEERGIQTCTEDMLYLFGEWERNVGLGLPNSPRSL